MQRPPESAQPGGPAGDEPHPDGARLGAPRDGRAPRVVERRSATQGLVDGAPCTLFAGCDYLGLSQHAEVRAAAVAAIERYGVASGASRATSGTTQAHLALEAALAEFLGVEAALVVEDGYVADLAVARGLADEADLFFVDQDSHASLVDAARLSGRSVQTYAGTDLTRLHALLDRGRMAQGRAVVMTDGVFTGNGRIAPASDLLRLLPPNDTLVIDDSHALGVLSDTGRGTLEVYGLRDPRIVVTSSLAKALGAAGGVIAGSRERIERIRQRAAPYIATTALNPASTGAALAAVGVLQRDAERVERLRANTGALHRMARRLGCAPRGTFLPVLRLVLEGDAAASDARLTELSDALRHDALYAPVIRYPGGGPAAQMRLTVCSEHTGDELARLEAALSEHMPSNLYAI
ncbi:MAG: pyridoxal phosphate-dependent aminotransferase family protein [Planctomycetota bacterium]